MTPLGMTHVGFGICALTMGAFVLALPKGTRSHRVVGYLYVACMVLLNATALGIYRLLGHFGPFHALALISLITLGAGLIPVLRKPVTSRAMIKHLMTIGWSYVGLWAATMAEIAVRVPAAQNIAGGMAAGTVAGTALAMLVGGGLLSQYRVRLIRELQAGSKPVA